MRKEDLAPSDPPRKKQRKQVMLPTATFLDRWPSLKTTLGHELVDSDFKSWYPNASELSKHNLDNLVSGLSTLRSTGARVKQLTYTKEINGLKNLIDSATSTEDTQNAAKIRMLGYLRPPLGRGGMNHHVSAIEVHESMLLLVKVQTISLLFVTFSSFCIITLTIHLYSIG